MYFSGKRHFACASYIITPPRCALLFMYYSMICHMLFLYLLTFNPLLMKTWQNKICDQIKNLPDLTTDMFRKLLDNALNDGHHHRSLQRNPTQTQDCALCSGKRSVPWFIFGLTAVTAVVQAVYVDMSKTESLFYGTIIRLERSISF